MTDKLLSRLISIKERGANEFYIEMYKSRRGSVISVSGVLKIIEITDDSVELLSRSGRMRICGENIVVHIQEDRRVELYGKITDISMDYVRR